MTSTLLSVLPVQDEEIHDVSPAHATLLKRLGMEALPAHDTLTLPTERLIVVGADHLVRSAKRLMKSIQHVGILQNPSVVVQENRDIHDAEATFEVVAGRRRVLAAHLAGLSMIKCEVYAQSTMPLSALLALIENEQRSSAWVREVEALRCLFDEKVGMTLDDLAAFGFDRATLTERLKIAQLPPLLLNRVLAGNVSREVARKLTRLSNAQQEHVASLALMGEEITAERVKEMLRVQINAGLVPIQSALVQAWNAPPSQLSNSDLDHCSIRQEGKEWPDQATEAEMHRKPESCSPPSTSQMSLVLSSLEAFVHSDGYRIAPQAVQTLTQALVQQLRLSLREAQVVSPSYPTVSSTMNAKE
jgi:ParB/RepB/Spo0J family partition protein